MSDSPTQLTTEQSKELLALARAGRLYDLERWIADGKSTKLPPSFKKSLLQVSVEIGFHSLVELVAKNESSQFSKDSALSDAVSNKRLDLIQLLVEHGANVKSVRLADVLLIWEPRIIRYFLERDVDVVTDHPFATAFCEKVRTALRPFIEYKQTDPEVAAALQEQADRALRHFCSKGDMKWISLLIWAGANPRSLGPDMERDYTNDPECYTSGLKEACRAENLDVLKKLKPDPTRDNLSELLEEAAFWGRRDALCYLSELGANPNDKEDGGSSALERCIWHLGFGPIGLSYGSRLRSTYDVYKAMNCIEELVRRGAKWKPSPDQINHVRRDLYGCEPKVSIELLRLLTTHDAVSQETIKELLRTPRMKQHLSTESWHLARLKLNDNEKKEKTAPPVKVLLERFNREELYQKVWAEPTRNVAKQYGVSDVWLSKVCKWLRVPHPGRGYWAKKAAGQPVAKRPPLPRLRSGEV